MLNLYKSNNEKVELLEKSDYEIDASVFKFGNLAIVFIKKEFTGVNFKKVYDEYRLTLENPFIFPIKFIESPAISITTASNVDYAYCSVIGVIRNESGVRSISLLRHQEITNTIVSIQLIAIGRYK